MYHLATHCPLLTEVHFRAIPGLSERAVMHLIRTLSYRNGLRRTPATLSIEMARCKFLSPSVVDEIEKALRSAARTAAAEGKHRRALARAAHSSQREDPPGPGGRTLSPDEGDDGDDKCAQRDVGACALLARGCVRSPSSCAGPDNRSCAPPPARAPHPSPTAQPVVRAGRGAVLGVLGRGRDRERRQVLHLLGSHVRQVLGRAERVREVLRVLLRGMPLGACPHAPPPPAPPASSSHSAPCGRALVTERPRPRTRRLAAVAAQVATCMSCMQDFCEECQDVLMCADCDAVLCPACKSSHECSEDTLSEAVAHEAPAAATSNAAPAPAPSADVGPHTHLFKRLQNHKTPACSSGRNHQSLRPHAGAAAEGQGAQRVS